MTVTARQFFNAKPYIEEFQTISLYHPAFGYLRFIKNKYFDKVLGGNTFQPATMDITESAQESSNTISYEVQMGRVGSRVKEFTKAIDNYTFGWMIPIEATAEYWLSDNLDAPYRPAVTLSVGNLAIQGDSVGFTLDTANPRGQAIADRYNGVDFPGTVVLS